MNLIKFGKIFRSPTVIENTKIRHVAQEQNLHLRRSGGGKWKHVTELWMIRLLATDSGRIIHSSVTCFHFPPPDRLRCRFCSCATCLTLVFSITVGRRKILPNWIRLNLFCRHINRNISDYIMLYFKLYTQNASILHSFWTNIILNAIGL